MGWFSSEKPKLRIDKQNKIFVEEILLWLATVVGDEIVRKRNQLFPVVENFNYKNLSNKAELFRLVEQVAELIELDKKGIHLDIYNSDEQSWKQYSPFNDSGDAQLSCLFISDKIFSYPELTLRTVALQLLEEKFKIEIPDKKWLQWTAEIAADYYGFGVINLRNPYEYLSVVSIRNLELSFEIHLYAICMLYELTGNPKEGLKIYLSVEDYKQVEQMCKAIRDSDDFIEFRKDWDFSLKKHPLYIQEVKLANYDLEKINVYSELISLHKERPYPGYYNGRGYVYLQIKKYSEAINDFNLAIEVDPYYSPAFDNRGLCKLMLGDMKGGIEDIETSLRLDSENSYGYRNKGIYYFMKGKFSLALENYLKAQEKEIGIDHIHFHLGAVYLALGDNEKARSEFEYSRRIPELPLPDYPQGY